VTGWAETAAGAIDPAAGAGMQIGTTDGEHASTPLRVAVVTPPWLELPPDAYGGVESVCSDLVDALGARGVEVTLLGPGEHGTTAGFRRTGPVADSRLMGQALSEAVQAAGCPNPRTRTGRPSRPGAPSRHQPVDAEHDQRTDQGEHPRPEIEEIAETRPEQRTADEPAEQSTDDPQQAGHDDTAGVVTRHDQLGQRAHHEPQHDPSENAHVRSPCPRSRSVPPAPA
jgi:hypothetical protein